MPNNFRKTGNRYAGKADRGDGLTPDTPSNNLATLLNAMTNVQTLVIGTGAWAGGVGNAIRTRPKIVADGTVIFVASDTTTPWCIAGGDGGAYDFDGIRWERYPSLCDPGLNGNAGLTMTRCYLFGCTNSFRSFNSVESYTDCIFDETNLSFQVTSPDIPATFLRCIFWSGTYRNINRLATITSSHFGPGATLVLRNVGELARITNCNMEGPIIIGDVVYSFDEARAAGLPASNISQPADYNKPEAQDFTLKVSSPHLPRAIGPAHFRFGVSYYFEMANGASAGDDVTVANCRIRSTANPDYSAAILEVSGMIWTASGSMTVKINSNGNFEGYLLTDKIRLFDRPQRIRRWSIVAGLNMNTDFPGVEPTGTQGSANVSVFNNNVPAYTAHTSGSAGRSPRRITEQARFSTNPLADVADPTTWETGAVFLELETNSELGYNVNPLRGSGAPDYDTTPANIQPIIARFVQARMKIRNNYYSK